MRLNPPVNKAEFVTETLNPILAGRSVPRGRVGRLKAQCRPDQSSRAFGARSPRLFQERNSLLRLLTILGPGSAAIHLLYWLSLYFSMITPKGLCGTTQGTLHQ
jgi:hypothetical protein